MKDRRAEVLLLVWKRTRPHPIEDLSQIPLPIGWIRESTSSWVTVDGRFARVRIDTTLDRYDIVVRYDEAEKAIECSKQDDATSLGVELVRVMCEVNENHGLPSMKRVIGESDKDLQKRFTVRR
jgi:hypothetical protein